MSRKTAKRASVSEGTKPFLRAVPHVNTAVNTELMDSGNLLVEVPLERPWYMVPPVTWILPFQPVRRIELDHVGRDVLELCDGQLSIEKMIEIFATTHKLSFREAQLPVTRFLRQLTRRGIVVLVCQKEDAIKQ